MRKTLAMILAALLLIGLLSGCDDEEAEPTQVTTQATTQPAEETTEPAEETTQPVEETTEPVGETTEPEDALSDEEVEETQKESSLNTAVLWQDDPELKVEYVLLAVNEEGPFRSEEISLNHAGADALIHWMLKEQSRKMVAEYAVEEFGEAVFALPEGLNYCLDWIPQAAEEDTTIHLSVAESFAQTGILDELIPLFEEAYGYTVEIQETTAAGTLTAAKLGIYDLVLTENSEAVQAFVDSGYARTVGKLEAEAVSLCYGFYLLCGPKDDPAGVMNCATLQDGFAAIAKGEHIFLSRGDALEQRFWPENEKFGPWYLSVDTQMGPLLVMNEFEGGYILADKLTWLIFSQNDGII